MLQQQQQQQQQTGQMFDYTPPKPTAAAVLDYGSGSGHVQNAESDSYVAPLLTNLRKVKKLRHLSAEQLRVQGSDWEIYSLLKGLLSESSETHWREKILASWSLSRATLNDEQRAKVVALLYGIIGKFGTAGSASWMMRIWNAFARVGKWVAPIVGTLIFGSILVNAGGVGRGAEGFLMLPVILGGLIIALMGLLSPFVIPYSLMVDADHYHEVRAAAVRALRTLGGVESLDLVAKMALESSPMTSGPARGTLSVLLPQLTPEHYGTLPAGFVADLCQILRYEAAWLTYPHENHTLGFRVVEALEKVGDGRAAVLMEKLLKGSVTPKLRDAMQRALPILQARREMENQRGMLLRGAESPIAVPQELLRPAVQSAAQTDPAELVRPVEILPHGERAP